MSPPLMRRVVVTGLGAISPLGLGVKATWASLLSSASGIKSLTAPEFAPLQSRIAGLVPTGPSSSSSWTASEHLSRDAIRRMPLFSQYALVAAREALSDADYHPTSEHQLEQCGVSIGSGIGAFEDVYSTSHLYRTPDAKRVSPMFVPRLLINLAAGHVSIGAGFEGPCHAVTTACSTGADCIGQAARSIEHGDADVILAGGSESCVHPLAIEGFERIRSLCVDSNDEPQKASRPFDKTRSGFVMAEGAAVLVLEEREHALSRGARVYAELVGWGATSDAYHLTQPRPDGKGASRSMRRALQVAGLRPKDVDYINAHATSTPLGDVAEARAIRSLMLDDDGGVEHEREVTVSSTKGATGHLLGAAGAIEALFSVLAIRDNVVPPTINLGQEDKDIPRFNFVAGTKQERKVDVVLTNSFAFGGSNATLCFRRMVD